MYALSIFDQQPVTNAEQKQFIDQAVEEILSGLIDPVQADCNLKALQDVIKAIRENDEVKDYTLTEAAKWGKSFTKNGVKIEVSSRTTNDYSGCGDELYNDMILQLEALKKQINARAKMLDAGINPETGQMYNPPKTETTTFLKYTF